MKSGKTSFYSKKLQPKPEKLNKGRGASFDHVRKLFFRELIAMKLSGKTDEEIAEWFKEQERKYAGR